ncbi:hypothetical protein [Bordetella hinzii]|uniref:Uncharacterized protein n=2 Tax=Bordetella hinzii TaxID=103855 RepID=A0AAN1RU30_9BORD|nr:hypothetical protein [Bordetella hinzii]AKQ54365.1 hypothetical protein ACR54_01018 [Bordetella hinzii]AKQ58879.1 hypothetical protein ACR55_00976 [Bordetella hinzii]AZW15845.1 hypothetical protein CS347_03125 [Bordetella hinzii]KCB25987.1 hypothetical protein L544_3191 [Bordetella hinzii OH87 BAL007II]KCB31151.1 hypothetical protein L543_3078 [Bordetella hinzii L60]
MLTDTVTRALSFLFGRSLTQDHIRGQFRYAYASEDGRYVAILTHDATTYVVDVNGGRYHLEPGVQPCGFSGHVLEVEIARGVAANDLFDLDMDAEEIAWRGCPAARAGGRAA